MSDWSFLGLALATQGIPADVVEGITDSYEPDPWRPKPDAEAVVVFMDYEGATRLTQILEAVFADHLDGR